MFSGLPHLEKLFLSGNLISTIPDGTFNDLRSLTRISFNSPVLQCDCYLKKVLKWSEMRDVRIVGTECALPEKLKGRSVADLRRRELVCNRDFQLKVFDIQPSESQLVFQGDKLPINCYASRAPGRMNIAWFRSGHMVTTNASLGVSVYTSRNSDQTVVNHKLVVEKLDRTHAGEWSCVVTTSSRNHTKTVTVDVRVPELMLECPAVQNRTAKGVFRWEQSVSGLVASQPCHSSSQQGARATHTCGRDGFWTSLNISACDFTKDITRKLSRFSEVTLTQLFLILGFGGYMDIVQSCNRRKIKHFILVVRIAHAPTIAIALLLLVSLVIFVQTTSFVLSLFLFNINSRMRFSVKTVNSDNVMVFVTRSVTFFFNVHASSFCCLWASYLIAFCISLLLKQTRKRLCYISQITLMPCIIFQDLSAVLRLASFPMEPVIYAGSGICMVCMLIVISTYISCYGTIGVPKKVKHAVINLCLSTLLMLGVFIAGINRTDMELPCQIAGICIHYFTLCSVFWITLTTNITYKKFLKASQPPEPPPDLGPMPLPPKPILQFYFVGYGVPLIICGITAAVSLQFYAGMKYCYLEWEPSLGAFYAPVTLLVAWNLILFMRISCVVRSTPDLNSESANESDQEIHTNEIELIPSQPDTITTVPNHRNISVVSIPDQERRPITQLRSLVAILFLFIVMWMCGALAIAKPFHRIIPSQELIFSYAYGAMSTLFGLFLVCYFCLTRQDWRLSG
ncbi:hypothetical protein EGW08_012579, partial [Elysia chlorotica]